MGRIARQCVILLLCWLLPVGWLLAQPTVRFGAEEATLPGNVQQTRGSAAKVELGQATNGKLNVLVQFKALPTLAERKQLQARGLQLEAYVGSNAYFALVRDGAKPRDFRGTGLRAVVAIQPSWKTDDALLRGQVPKWARRGEGAAAVVRWFSNAHPQLLAKALEQQGLRLVQMHEGLRQCEVEGSLQALQLLARQDYVAGVSFVMPPEELTNREGSTLGRANVLARPVEDGGRGLTGKGVRVGLWDANVQHHVDFGQRIHSKEFEMGVGDSRGHGMHTCGTIAGAGLLDPKMRGMAPEAEIWAWNFNTQENGLSVQDEMGYTRSHYGISLTSNSYGLQMGYFCEMLDILTYSALGVDADVLACKYPNLTHFHSAGNDQNSCSEYSSSTKRAKNIITVGALNKWGEITDFSSFGPTDDGRLLPIVCAKGEEVYSTLPNNSYGLMSGTSMSCPMAAGMAALLTQRYHQLYANADPNAALVKALLANTADDLGRPGPDYQYGYGSVNILKAVEALEAGSFVKNSMEAGAQPFSHKITVPEGIGQLRVMICWLDPPILKKTAFREKALVNDLNLKVSANGQDYSPWVLNPEHPEDNATTGVDSINNIEQVVIDHPAAGDYDLQVSGKIASSDGTQEFFLVWFLDPMTPALSYPIGGERFEPGEWLIYQTENFHLDKGNPLTIEISYDGGKNYVAVSTSTFSRNGFQLPADAPFSDQCILRLTDEQGHMVMNTKPFTIAPRPKELKIARGTSACGEGAKLSWQPVAGDGVTYTVLRAAVDNGQWQEVADALTEPSYTLKAGDLARQQRTVFAVKAVKGTASSERSVGVCAPWPQAIDLTTQTLPLSENFIAQPSTLTFVTPGKNVQVLYEGATPGLGLPVGAHLMLAKVEKNLDATVEPFSPAGADNMLELATCNLKLPALGANEKLVFSMLQFLGALQHPVDRTGEGKEYSQLRLLNASNGQEIPSCGGESRLKADEQEHLTLWDLSALAGQEVQLSLQWWSRYKGDAFICAGYTIEKLTVEGNDVRIYNPMRIAPAPNLGVRTMAFNITNVSTASDPIDVSVAVKVRGELQKGLIVKALKPLEERRVTFEVDLSTKEKLGEEIEVTLEAIVPHDSNPTNNLRSLKVKNLGNVVPLQRGKSFSFMGFPIFIDPYTTYKLKEGESVYFTDDGGAKWDYYNPQHSSLTFYPTNEHYAVQAEVIEYDLMPDEDVDLEHTLEFYTSDAPEYASQLENPIAVLRGKSDPNAPHLRVQAMGNNGSVTIRLMAEIEASKPYPGWVIKVSQVKRTNAVSIAAGKPVSSIADGKVTIPCTLTNHTSSPLKALKVQLSAQLRDLSSVTPDQLDPQEQLIDLEPNASKECSFSLEDISDPAEINYLLSVNFQETDQRDNQASGSLIHDHYFVGGKLIDPQRAVINKLLLGQTNRDDIDLGEETHGQRIQYCLGEQLDHYKGNDLTIRAYDLTLSQPTDLVVWFDLNNDLQFVDAERQVLSLAPNATEGTLTFTADQLKDLEEGDYRLRVALLPKDKAADFAAGTDVPFGHVQDFNIFLSDQEEELVPDIVLAECKGLSSGANLSSMQPVVIVVKNEGSKAITAFTATLEFDGKTFPKESFTANIEPDQEQEFTLKPRLDLRQPGLHQVSVTLEGDSQTFNNSKTYTLCSVPEVTNPPVALTFSPKGPGVLQTMPVDFGREFTLEGWYFLDGPQFATLLSDERKIRLVIAHDLVGIEDQAIALQLGRGLYYTKGNAVTPYQWNHIALTVKIRQGLFVDEITEVKFFVNGKEYPLAKPFEVGSANAPSGLMGYGVKFKGQMKYLRAWKKVLAAADIQANMLKPVVQNGNLPQGCLYEFLANEGAGAYLVSGAQWGCLIKRSDYASSMQRKKPAKPMENPAPMWTTLESHISQVEATNQVLPAEHRGDGSWKLTLPAAQSLTQPVEARFTPTWPFTSLSNSGTAFTGTTSITFDNGAYDKVTASCDPSKPYFGAVFSNVPVKLYVENDYSPECDLLKLTLGEGATAVEATPTNQEVVFSIEAALFDPDKLAKASLTVTQISPEAVVLFNGKTYNQGETLTMDLTKLNKLTVRAANQRNSKIYVVRVQKKVSLTPQTITWDQSLGNMPFSAAPVALSAVTDSELPVVYLSDNPNVATIRQGKLVLVGLGSATISATQPGDGIKFAAAAKLDKVVTVEKGAITVKPKELSVAEGLPLPELSFDFEGVQGDEYHGRFQQPHYGVEVTARVFWDEDQAPLHKGDYQVKPLASQPTTYDDGNYAITLDNGTLHVTEPNDQTIRLDIAALGVDAADLDKVKIFVNDMPLIVESGKAYIQLAKLMVPKEPEPGATVDPNAKPELEPKEQEVVLTVSCEGYLQQTETITVKDANVSKEYTLAKCEVTITYKAGPNGSIVGIATQPRPKGTMTSSVVAVPDKGYRFKEWDADPKDHAIRSDKAEQDQTITASFEPMTLKANYTVTEGGKLASGSLAEQNVAYGANAQEVTVEADPGYAFVQWSDGKLERTRTDTKLTQDVAVQAIFMKPYNLPYKEDFDNQSTAPSYWSHGKDDQGEGFTFYVSDTDQEPIRRNYYGAFPSYGKNLPLSVVKASLLTPWLSLEGRTDADLQLQADLAISNGVSKPVTLSYRFGEAEPWNQLLQYAGNRSAAEPISLDKSKLAGKAMVQFAWYVEHDNASGKDVEILVDNVSITTAAAGLKVDRFYRAGDNGTLLCDGKSLAELRQEEVEGTASKPVEAKANDGYFFQKWSDGSTDNPRTDKGYINVTAHFAPKPDGDLVTLTYEAKEHGILEGPTFQQVPKGSTAAAVIAVPDPGYELDQWDDGHKLAIRNDKAEETAHHVASFKLKDLSLVFIVLNDPDSDIPTLYPGATVSVKTQDGQERSVETDKDGRAVFKGGYKQGDEVSYMVSLKGYGDVVNEAYTVDETDLPIKVAIAPAVSVSLTLLDELSGQPVASAKALLNGDEPNVKGSIAWKNQAPGEHSLTVQADHYIPIEETFTAKKDTTLTLNLQRERHKLTVTVVDAQNQPVEKVAVSVGAQPVVFTNDKGVALVPDLIYGVDYDCQASLDQRISPAARVTIDGDKELTLQLKQALSVLFSVTLDGQPASQATVIIGGQALTTDAQGLLTYATVAGTLAYSCALEGYPVQSGSVEVTDDGQKVEIAFKKAAPGKVTLAFRVTLDGKALSGAKVKIAETSDEQTTDAAGQASFTLPAGSYSYTVTAPDGQSIRGKLTVTGNTELPIMFSQKSTPVESALLAQAALQPNPFAERCQLVNVASMQELTIVSATGVVVRTIKHNGAETLTLDTQALPQGLYLFRLRDHEGHFRTLSAIRR